MKILIIYLSVSGNTKKLAQVISNKMEGADLLPIELKTSIPKSKFWLIFKFGFLMSFRKAFRYKIKNIDVSAYDHVLIGSPVWMGLAAPPVLTVVERLGLSDKVRGVFVTCGAEEGTVFDDVEARLSVSNDLARLAIVVSESYEDPDVQVKIQRFIQKSIPQSTLETSLVLDEG